MHNMTDIVVSVIATAVGLVVVFVIIFGALFMDMFEKDNLTITPDKARKLNAGKHTKTKRRKI